MVAMPASLLGDFLLTERTNTLLLEPQTPKRTLSVQFGQHFCIYPFLKVGFQVRVIRVGSRSYFGMALNRDTCCLLQPYTMALPIALADETTECPTAA